MFVPRGNVGPPPIPSNLQPPAKPDAADKDVKLRPVFTAIWGWMSVTGQFLTKLAQFAGYYQLGGVAPTKHNSTHLPNSEQDPLPVGVAVGLGNENAEGEENDFSRSDHVHKRDVRVFQDGVEIGTRNHLNVVGGLTATDDSGNDAIIISAETDVADLEFLIWVGL